MTDQIASLLDATTPSKKPSLKIIDFSGTEGATKNMYVYECGDDIIVVDVGIGFPDDTMPGVEVLIPDFSYLIENQHKIRGVFITHAHEDHLGAVPFLLKELDVPIYANKLVQAFIKEKIKDLLSEAQVSKTRFHLIGPEVGEVVLGNFTLSFFRLNHSVPTTLGFSITTPQGRILHVTDFKVDFAPIIDPPLDIAQISAYGQQGVLCLLSDCLGSEKEGYSRYEQSMKHIFHDMFEKAENRQVVITTISSNISRILLIIEGAIKSGRKVVVSGRSIGNSIRIARELKIIQVADDSFVDEGLAAKFPQKDLVYLIAGCYGQPGSALSRAARNEHKHLSLEPNAMVIFAADPSPPSAKVPVERLKDTLTLAGAEVIYSGIQENLHVSGHGPKGDLTLMATIVKPKYFVPIGGSPTQTRAYTKMIEELGYDGSRVFEMQEGDVLEFAEGKATLGPRLQTKEVYIDAGSIDEIGKIVVKDRERLSDSGVFVIVVPISRETKKAVSGVEVITRGFVYVKDSMEMIGKTKDKINKLLEKEQKETKDWKVLQYKIEKDTQKFLYKLTGKEPMVIVHSIQI